MKILYLHFLYGQDTALNHVGQFAAAARQLGHDVDVVALNLGNASAGDDAAAGARRESSVRAFLKRSLGRYLHEPKELWWNARYRRLIESEISDRRPDVVLARDEVLNYSFIQAAERAGAPIVMEVNAPALEARLFLDQYWHLPLAADRIERWKLRRASQVTVVSGALRDHLVERHDLDAGKFTVVPNGADTDVFHPQLQPDASIGLEEGGVVVGFVGSFQKWHGTDRLTAMAQEIGKRDASARFLFVGDGPQLPGVRAALESLGPRAVLTGRCSHARVPGLVAWFDIGVVAQAAFYMSPLKVLEWMAAGVAVVAPDQGPLRELIDDGVHGLLFDPDDPAALEGAVGRLLEDAELRRRLGRAAVSRVQEHLTWRHNAERVLGACDRAVASARRAA